MTSPHVASALCPPRLLDRVITRPRLLHRVDRAEDVPLTLVTAGPGWGKTVLLSDWARTAPHPPAWFTLSARENRPERFWNTFARALCAVSRRDAEASAMQPRPLVTAIDALDWIDAWAAATTGRSTIVIDDAHLLSDPDIIDGLDQTIAAMGDRIRIIMAARTDPLLPVYRYRLQGRIAELRAADLAMTEDETVSLLEAHDVVLPPHRVAVLTRRTEGWVAGLRLSALRMQGNPAPIQFVDEFALDQGSIGEYLTREVLEQLPARVRRLLVETSHLDELDASLAERITGNARARDDLIHLSRSNSFIVALESTRRRFRVHQLMREILQYLFSELPLARQQQRYIRTADWFATHGDPAAAIRWAIAAQDTDAVTALLTSGGIASAYISLSSRSEFAAIDFRPVADELAQRTESSCITAWWAMRSLTADTSEVPTLLAQAAVITSDTTCSNTELATRRLARLILAERIGAHDVIASVLTESRHAIAAAFPNQPELALAMRIAQLRAWYCLGHAEHLDDLVTEVLESTEQADATQAAIDAWSLRAAVAASDLRLQTAAEAIERAADLLAAHPDLARSPTLDMAVAARAHVTGDTAILDQAGQRLRAGGMLHLCADAAAAVALLAARRLIESGRFPQAATLLVSDAALASRGHDRYALARDCELADLETQLGRPQTALRTLEEYAGTAFDLDVAPAIGRAQLALGQVHEARRQARKVLTAAAHVSRYVVIEAMLCDAAAALSAGDEAGAVERVERAVTLAQGETVRPFTATTEAFRPLLAQHPQVAQRWPAGLAVAPQRASVSTPEHDSVTADRAIPDPLTDRERSVLRFLCTNLSGKDIADELCISVHTVRTHQAAIYRKLSAGNRRDAVRHARSLELI